MSIDMIMLDEINYKWSTRTIEKLRNKLAMISKDVDTNASDSKDHELTKNY